jgi:Na+/melibiose symporter-like transporter
MDNAAFVAAAIIAVIGYLGNFLSGTGNTIFAIIGSALASIVPLITTGHIDWKLIAATVLLKLVGLFSDGRATVKTNQ